MDDRRSQIADGAIYVRGNVIEQVGPTSQLPETADQIIDARDHIVLPGLVNAHHHFFQILTRALPAAQNAAVGNWLAALAPLWDRITSDGLYVSTLVAICELLRSGCTTTCDHLYYVPDGCRVVDEVRAARELGIRLQLCYGRSPPPSSKAERISDEEVLRDCQETIEQFHDKDRLSMIRVGLAGSLIYDPPDLQRELRSLTKRFGVRLHLHVAETKDQAGGCIEKFGHRSVEHAILIGWVGPDVWFAHGVHVNSDEIRLLAETETGIVHCPSSNMRLGSGIAPIVEMLREGVRVGLGVDGSASNDSSHMLAEARQALLLQRVSKGPETISAEDVLWLATAGGAQVMGRDDLGQLKPGMAADLVAFDLNVLDLAGSRHDPAAALIFCSPQRASWVIVNGKVRVWEGQVLGVDINELVQRHNQASRELLS
jgi:8-oxoguanine deaminase